MQQQQAMFMTFMKQQQQQTQQLMELVLSDKHHCSCSHDEENSVPPGEWLDSSEYETEEGTLEANAKYEWRPPMQVPTKRRLSVGSVCGQPMRGAQGEHQEHGQEMEWASRKAQKPGKDTKREKKKNSKGKNTWAGTSLLEESSSLSSESDSDESEEDEEVEPSRAEVNDLRGLSQNCWSVIEVAEAEGWKGAPRCKNELERIVGMAKALEDVMTLDGARALARAMKTVARGAFGDWGASKANKSKLDKLSVLFPPKKAKELLARSTPNGYAKAAARGVAITGTAPTTGTPNATTTTQTKKRGCFRCGDFGHAIAQCKLKENVCYKCKSPGHVQRVCPGARSFKTTMA